jgi:Large polyvalent protein associated domain 22
MERRRDAQIRDGLLSAPAPDAVARTEKLARDTGTSVADVQGNEDSAEHGLQVRNFVDLASGNPAVARWAANNPRGAAMAKDDYDSLSLLGKLWHGVTMIPGALRTSFDTLGVQGAKVNAAIGDAVGSVYAQLETLAQPGNITIGEMERRRAARSSFWDAGVQASEAKTESRRQKYGGYLEQTIIGQGLESLVPSLGAGAIGALTRSPSLATGLMATSVGGPAYYDARKAGLDAPTAIRYGIAQGGTEYVTERLPASTLVDLISRKTPFGKAVLRELGQEVAGENVATILQDLADWQYLPENHEKTVGQYLAERPQAALDTTLATVGGVAGNTSLVGAVQRATDATASVARRVGEVRQARRERTFLNQAAKAAGASKLKQRDPESFRSLVREQAEEAGAASVFIPGEAIRIFNQSEAYDPDNDPLRATDTEDAVASGGDVVMPIEDFLTDVVGTPAWEAIKDDIRLTQGGMSPREAQTFEEAMDDVVAQAADELARNDREERASRTVRDQLVDRVAGMFGQSFTSPVARQYAEIAVQRAQTRAQRLGLELTAQDLDDLAVRQILPEGVTEAVSADRLDLVINALRTGANPRYGIGPTLLEFIRERGGMNDVGGDLASMGVPSRFLTGYDPRQGDLTGGVSGIGDFGLDNTLRAAITAGYFPDLANVENEQGPSTLDTQRLLDAIEEELGGRPNYAEWRTDDVRASAEDLRQTLEDAGYSPSNMTDDDIRDVVDSLSDQVQATGRAFEQAKSAERGTAITRNGDVEVAVTSITSGPVSFEEAKAAFAEEVKPAIATMITGEQVVFTQARKAVFSKSDRFNPALRFELIPHLPDIVAGAASFATTTTGAQADHAYVHAVARVRLNGQDISIRLVLKDVGDGSLRQYQIEGFEAAAAPAGMFQSDDLDKMAPATAASHSARQKRPRNVREVVSDFKGRQLFQETRGRAVFEENRRVIELFKGRDLSTPIHELGHVWLEELAADAALEIATDQLRADWAAVRTWFAHSGHAIGEDGTIPTEAHELFARGIERYFMEGKAPTTALNRIFENVRQWMLSIYRSVSQLRSQITPEIREVFNRMLASDEEITAARDRQGIEDLFKDAAEAGMTQAEFAAYQEKSRDANAVAHAKLLDRVMSTIRRRETERYREARKVVRAEEEERIDASPLFRAMAAMDTKQGGNRISKDWIADRLGLDALGLLPRRVPPLYVEGGVNPESIAELAGYSSATEMLEALIGAERVHRQEREGGDKRSMRERAIENATDAEMNRRYGDPLNDGSIEQEALGAVQSEMLGEVISSEIRALGRRTGRGPLPYQVARDWARGKVRSGKWIDVASPGALVRHARNASRAAKAAEAALVAGDHAEAYRQKQFQMLNNAMAAEAYAAAEEVETARKRMEGIAEAKTRKAVDQDYLEQAQMLLEAVDLKRRSQIYERRKGSFAAWASAREAEGFDVVVPETFEATLGLTNWSKMPVEDILMLDEAIKQIMHLGRLKQSLVDAQEEREWEAIEQEAVDAAENIRGKLPADLAEPRWWESLGRRIAGIDASLLKMETVFDWLDGGNSNGVFNRIVFRPIAAAQAREADMIKDYQGRIKKLFEAVPKEIAARWQDRMVLPFIDVETGKPMVLNRQQLVAMALNVGNEGNLQRLADGYRLNGGALVGYLDETLTKEEWQLVQSVWDEIDTLWPEIKAIEKKVNGVAPDKVRARKFNTTTAGQMRGGYYPAVYDTSRDYRAQENAGKERDILEGSYTKATTRASSTKARDEQVKRPILLDLGVINRHLGEVIHDITHREAVIVANRFLSSERVRRAVDAALGQEIGNQFRPWVKFVANSWAIERAGNEGIGRWLGKLRANATAVGMGLRATTMVTQIAGYSNSMEVVGEVAMGKALAQFARNPAEAVRSVMERSDEVRHRMGTLDRDIRTEIARLSLTNPATKAGALVMDGRKFFFHGIGYMDLLVSVPTWMAAYENGLTAGMSEADAAYAGDKAVRQSQGAGGAKDLAAIQRGTGKWGEALKLMTMFYSYFSAQYQRQRMLARDVMGEDSRRPRNMPRLVARAFFLLVLPPLLTEVLRGAVGAPSGPEDDEWWAQWLARKLLANSLGPIPVVRDIFEPSWNAAREGGFSGTSISPLQRSLESFVRSAGDVGALVRGDETKHATKDVLETTGYLTGLVPGQIASATQFLVDVGRGDADPEGFRDWMEGLSTGKLKE